MCSKVCLINFSRVGCRLGSTFIKEGRGGEANEEIGVNKIKLIEAGEDVMMCSLVTGRSREGRVREMNILKSGVPKEVLFWHFTPLPISTLIHSSTSVTVYFILRYLNF